MRECKIIFLLLSVIICLLCCNRMWFAKQTVHENKTDLHATDEEDNTKLNKENDQVVEPVLKKKKVIPLLLRNACSSLEIFTVKPITCKKSKPKKMDDSSNSIAVIGMTVFLIGLSINAILDALKVKEEERIRKKENPNGPRRQSLAEFANKKTLRRESSKFGLQLFQIAESVFNPEEAKKNRRQARPYVRGESTNSYLSEKNAQIEASLTPRSSETPTGEPRIVKRQSPAKIFGARPAPMVRRSSFPALPLNPDIQALMLGNRRPSTDSDDEDGRGRRVRIIRRS